MFIFNICDQCFQFMHLIMIVESINQQQPQHNRLPTHNTDTPFYQYA